MSDSTFNMSVLCITNLAPPETSSTALFGGMLKSLQMYLVVDPPTLTNTSILIAEVNMFAILIPMTASFEFAVTVL